ncbi:universal stress protein [Leisingera methylohalidivorans]|uniref:Universal stress protein UspA n=1 Tax=Leisingera methylohalidivorans DSM 14336 TaxID=999552 RepID=V9W0N2_9RHOB|nr:universal stress protein [Leisingera methylohalidivorans]AHD03698.1 universal stress protein UspA [Leisingera methylohalidivorans DSM 14336]
MQRTTSLLALSKDCSDTSITTAAEAALEQEAHLACLLLDTMPGIPGYAYGSTIYGGVTVPDSWLELLQQSRKDAERRAAEIKELLSRSGCSGDVQYAVGAGTDIRLLTARRASSCDIAQAAEGLRKNEDVFREAMHGVLFQSPIALMLNGTPFASPSRVFLAWNSSLAASRAAHAALPYFRKASEVVIGCFDPDMSDERDGEDPGTDVAAWLSHHGCSVTVSQFPSGGHEIGRGIRERAKEAGAGLVVMGAYGHSRVREAVFGGTTRTMMEQADLPVLFAH